MNSVDERIDRKMNGLMMHMEKCFAALSARLPTDLTMDDKIPPTVSPPVTISFRAVTVSMSPTLTKTANTSCSKLLSYAQSVPRSVSSTGYIYLSDSFVTGMSFPQSYSGPAVATGSISSTGRTYTASGNIPSPSHIT